MRGPREYCLGNIPQEIFLGNIPGNIPWGMFSGEYSPGVPGFLCFFVFLVLGFMRKPGLSCRLAQTSFQPVLEVRDIRRLGNQDDERYAVVQQ